MSTWDATQYTKFTDQRFRPALDLLSRIPSNSFKSICDLGCGTGNVTEVISHRWPTSKITGLDNSAEMLKKTKPIPGVEWVQEDIANWLHPHQFELLFSNATLQWLPDHKTLFPKILEKLSPGGYLAVQMPRNNHAPTHQAIMETALNGPWKTLLRSVITSMPSAESPGFYYDLLRSKVAALDIWETEYLQVLEGENAAAEWTKGSVLKPILDTLTEPWREQFWIEYCAKTSKAYPRSEDGRTLLPFRRIFIVANL